MTDDDLTGLEPALGGPDHSRAGGNEPWLGGAHGFQQWLDALNSDDNHAIWRGARGLARQGAAAIPRLLDALTHPDYRVQAVAAWAVGQFAEDQAVLEAAPRLAALLGARQQSVRIVAARALARLVEHHPGAAPEAEAALRAYRRGRP